MAEDTDNTDKIDNVATLIDDLTTEVEELSEDSPADTDQEALHDLKKAVKDAGKASDELEDDLEAK